MPSMFDIARRALDKVTGYRLGGGAAMMTMEIPASMNTEAYLKAYGQVGWLFGVVSVISQSVAEVDWALYRRKTGGELEEIPSHPMLDLWRYVNPFQTKYQFILLMEMYLKLLGEAFIVLTLNSRREPVEMWLAPPQYMKVIPHDTEYISGYRFERGGKAIPFAIDEVIHIMSPNPAQPMRGIGPAQSVGIEIDSERNAARYQNKLFYNDGRPGMLVEFPETQGIPPEPERKKIIAQWNAMHSGWANAYKTGFLWGGAKANTVTLNMREMEFEKLRKLDRDTILGAFHVPHSVMGIGDIGSRARAEADDYIFAKRVIKPALTEIREPINEQMIPMFDRSLVMSYENPVPENREALVKEATETVKARIRTQEEGREMLGLDRKPDPGDTFVEAKPPGLADMSPVPRAVDEEAKEAQWRKYVSRAEKQEGWFKRELKKQFTRQKDDVIKRLREAGDGATVEGLLFNSEKEEEEFVKGFQPLIEKVFVEAWENALEDKKSVRQLNELAVMWIAEKSLALATMVNGTTKEQLRPILAAALAKGEGIPKVVKAISTYYVGTYRWRAMLVARTETIAANNEGALQRYREEGIERQEYYAALDERTCDECNDYHGRIFATSECSGMIPVHPQCRCTFVPIVD